MDFRKIFQYVLMGLGGVLFVVGIAMFAGYRPSQQAEQDGTKANLTMWGWIDSQSMLPVVTSIQSVHKDLKISYKEIPEAEFDKTIVEALAAGQGPDLLLVDTNHMLQYRSRLETISFTQYSEAQYRSEFINAAAGLALPWGIVAFPLAVDPIVLYSNRDILSAGYVAEPAATWEQVLEHVKLFTKASDTGVISLATIPLGSYSNIEHASDIIWMLVFQQGNPLVAYVNGQLIPTVRGIPNAPQNTDTSIARPLQFFSAFSDPGSEAYTWNSAFTRDRDAFISGESVYYLGLASEYNLIRKKNPNLNFSISIAPQISTEVSAKKRTSARVYGVAMTKLSKQKQAAFVAMQTLSGAAPSSILNTIGFAPARLDLVSRPQTDPRLSVIYKSALISQTWWNPDQEEISTLLAQAFRALEAQTENIYDSISRIDAFISRKLTSVVAPAPAGSASDGPF